MQIQVTEKNLPLYKKYLEVTKSVRSFFAKANYLEVDAPVMSPVLIPESYVDIFQTEYIYGGKNIPLYLTPSPELFMKRLMTYGIGNCYYLGKAFRNSEQPSTLHNIEFTMLEFYKTNVDYMQLADEVLSLLRSIAQHFYNKDEIVYQGKSISFASWEKISVTEAFQRFVHISENELFDKNAFIKIANKKGYRVEGFSYEDIFSQIYVQEIEPNLGKNGMPTLLYDFPKEFAALAKLNPDKKTAQRFEFYIEGIELGDAYTELTDWNEQKNRFETEEKKRIADGKSPHAIDKGYLERLQYGLTACAGIAIGFERFAMIFADATSIDQLKLITIR